MNFNLSSLAALAINWLRGPWRRSRTPEPVAEAPARPDGRRCARGRWTLDDHRRASHVLREMHRLLLAFYRPPLSGGPPWIGSQLATIGRAIDQLRSRLEDAMFRDLRGRLPADPTEVYYPGNDEKGRKAA